MGFQRGRQCKHDPPLFFNFPSVSSEYCLDRQTDRQGRRENRKDNNKYNCCGDMRVKGGENKKREIKTLTATTLRNIMFLGQGAVRAVWILSAMKARGAAACCTASAFIPPLARSLWKVWPAGLKERSSGLHQLSPGRRTRADFASSHIYSRRHASIRTLYSVKLRRLKPKGGEEGRGKRESESPERLLDES